MKPCDSIAAARDLINAQRLERRLIRVSIIFKSPITNKYESRVGYFHERMEAHIWETYITDEYEKLGFEYVVYVETICR